MITITIKKTHEYELIGYHLDDKLFYCRLLPGADTLAQLKDYITTNNDDLIIKNDEQEIARYANFKKIVSLQQNYENEQFIDSITLAHIGDAERIQQLEEQLMNVKTTLTSTQTDIASLNNSMTTATANITNLNTNVNTLNTDVTLAKTNINTLNTDLNTTQMNVENLNNSLTDTQTTVTTIQNDLATTTDDIQCLTENLNTTQDAVDYLIMK